MFNDYLNNLDDFKIRDAIIPNVSEIDNLDLLPSSLELIEIQYDIPKVSNPYVNSVDVLGNYVSSVKEKYDYILIDCLPNLGTITLNGITISDYYIVPTIPDILSKYGIQLILNRIEKFQAKKKTCAIKLAGIVFTKVEGRTTLHRQTMHSLTYANNPGTRLALFDNTTFFNGPNIFCRILRRTVPYSEAKSNMTSIDRPTYIKCYFHAPSMYLTFVQII